MILGGVNYIIIYRSFKSKKITPFFESEEFKKYPQLFTSQTLARVKLKDIQTIIQSEEFKRYLEVGKFTAYLNKISANNQNSEIDVQFRSIEGSPFYQQCKDAVYLLEKQFEKGETLGVRWLNNGNVYSFGGFTNEEAGALVNAFNSVIETSHKPEMGPANKFMDNFDFLDGFGE